MKTIKRIFLHKWFHFRLSLVMILLHLTLFVFGQHLSDIICMAFWAGQAIVYGVYTKMILLRDELIDRQNKLIEELFELSQRQAAQNSAIQDEIAKAKKQYENVAKN